MKKEKLIFYSVVLYTIAVYGTMATMSIGAGLVFAAWLFCSNNKTKQDWLAVKKTSIFIPTLVLSFACVWSLVWAKATDLTFLGMKPNIVWIDDTRKLWHLFFPFVLFLAIKDMKSSELRKIYFIWLIAGLLSAVFGVIQHYIPIYNPQPLPNKGINNLYHATGFAGFHLSYISILAFPAAAYFSLVAILYRRHKVSKRTLQALFCSAVFFTAGIFSYSKSAWVAFPLTVVFIALVGFKGLPRYLILGAIVVFAAVWASSPQVASRFDAWQTFRDRMDLWWSNTEMIKQFPLFGVGWHHNSELSHAYYTSKLFETRGAWGFQSHAHNNFLDQLSTTGIFGLLAFLWWNYTIVILCRSIYKRNHDLAWRSLGLGLLSGWFCLHINGLTQTNFWDAKVMHQIGWTVAIALRVNLFTSRS